MWMSAPALAILQSLILISAANGAPVLVARLLGARFARPIDGGIVLRDGHPLLGRSSRSMTVRTLHRRSTTSSPTPGPEPRCAAPETRRAPGAWRRRSTSSPSVWGVNPLALRERIDPSPVRREERRVGAEKIGWSRRHAPGADTGPIKRGMGMAQSLWGANVQTASFVEVRILRDGSVEARSSVQDIGSGIGVVIAQTIAETLGLTPEQIRVLIGPTRDAERRCAAERSLSCRCTERESRCRAKDRWQTDRLRPRERDQGQARGAGLAAQ